MSSDAIRLGATTRTRMYLPAMRGAPLKTSYLVLRTPDLKAFVTKLRRDTSGEPWKVEKDSALGGHALIGEFGTRAAADECASLYERALQQRRWHERESHERATLALRATTKENVA